MIHPLRAAALAGLLALAGCATAPSGIDTTRFHLGQPIARGTVAIEPVSNPGGGSLEYSTYSQAVAGALGRAGFTVVPSPASAEYLATFDATQQQRPAAERRSGFSIGLGGGIGGGGYRSGGGVGAGVQIPVGGARSNLVAVNMLALNLRRRSDRAMVWEGRASEEASGRPEMTGLAAAVPRLADALLAGFPGQTGTTVRVKPGR